MPARGGKVLRALLEVSAEEAIQVAAAWLTLAMKNLVDIKCGAAGHGRGDAFDTGHSPVGGPPYRETGRGQASIDWEPISGGAIVGTRDMGIENMLAGNYMAGWDAPAGIRGARRPWLSLFFTDKRYQKEFSNILLDQMRAKTGGR